MLIVLHVVSKTGFLKGLEHVWKANTRTDDYHDEMMRDKSIQGDQKQTNPAFAGKVRSNHQQCTITQPFLDKCHTQASRKAKSQAWSCDFQEDGRVEIDSICYCCID